MEIHKWHWLMIVSQVFSAASYIAATFSIGVSRSKDQAHSVVSGAGAVCSSTASISPATSSGVPSRCIGIFSTIFSVPGDNIGVLLTDAARGRSAFYAPGLGEITPALFDIMCGADAVLVDGTFWTDDEMIGLGLSRKTAREIGHLPQSGPGGMIEWLDRLPARTRRLLIHINNTNPILDEDSPERALLQAHGIEVCADKMTIVP